MMRTIVRIGRGARWISGLALLGPLIPLGIRAGVVIGAPPVLAAIGIHGGRDDIGRRTHLADGGIPVTNTRPKKIPAEERRNITVEAVIDLAGSSNPDSITTAAIAKHMKLTQGAIFRHFPNKEAIWKAVVEWVARNLMARIDAAAGGIASPVARMEAMFLAHVGFVADHPGAPRMLFGELQGARMTPAKRLAQGVMRQYAARLHDLIADGKACGELRDDLDTEAAAALFIGTIQGLVVQSLIAGDIGKMRVDAPRVFAIYLRGIAADTSRMAKD